jgi:response regulator RpfG family c-di-GMP phosphodiesterase
LQSYACGAVDYVTVPVVPVVLRAKVNVFVELHRRQRELEQLKSELERRVEERTAELAKSEQRYRAMVDNANDVVATLDLEGRWTSPDLVESRSLLPCRRREPRLEVCGADVAEARVPSARVIEAFDVLANLFGGLGARRE